jgi:hypothetical protein
VEYWIVKAIALKILDCKVDQLNQTAIVRYFTFYGFCNSASIFQLRIKVVHCPLLCSCFG